MWLHRLSGYANILLPLVGNTGAFMVSRHAVGGTVESQVLFGFLGIYTTTSLIFAYVSVKRLLVEQHRAWMLRAWVVAAAIISQWLIMLPVGKVMSRMGDYHAPLPCHTIEYITSHYGESQVMRYPSCREDHVGAWASVKVDQYSTTNSAEIGASVNASISAVGIVALVLHVLEIELYLALTEGSGIG